MLTLVLGGARSGKSSFAEQFAKDSGKSLVYIATATAGDQEMHDRISHHQNTRDKCWMLIEEPVYLAETLEKHCANDTCVLIDCLTLWLTNLLLDDNPLLLEQEKQKLLRLLKFLPGDILFVSNEVGTGLIAPDPISRRFVDESGRLHQTLASDCDKVIFVTAGIPQTLKSNHV